MGKSKKHPGYDYQVERALRGTSVGMGPRTAWRPALSRFLSSPRAFGIQRYVKGTNITAGLQQPTIPDSVTVNGKKYTRGYVGHHTKRMAQRLAKSFREEGHKAVTRKIKGGWHVFVKFDQRRL